MRNGIWIDNSSSVQPMFRNNRPYKYKESLGDGKNILFAGCSITANVGLADVPNGGWSQFLTDQLKNDLKISVSNNCSISGASTFEIISNVFRFLNNYEKPDMIFLLLPPVQREIASYSKTLDAAKVIDYNIFAILNQYCVEKDIQLFASTWDFYIPGVTSWFVDDNNDDLTTETLKEFDSYFIPNKINFAQDVFEASLYGSLSLEGYDRHPSEPVHAGYANMFYEEYENRK